MPLAEEFLHYVWQQRLFTQGGLSDCANQSLSIVQPGLLNPHAGPDFSNAKIQIGDTLWAGNVEIHIKASDWQRHNHQFDDAYDSVILHVVWQNDADVYRSNGTLIPALELEKLVSPTLIAQYEYLKQNTHWIPCQNQLPSVDAFVVQQWLHRVLVERLENKSEAILALNQQLQGNWEQTFYVTLAQAFGFKVNALPFAMLAQALPQQIFAKHKHHPLQIEALIFGQAGFLTGHCVDDYPAQLKKEYAFLSQKYQLSPMDKSLWKFSKLRPRNFPTIRLAQFAATVIASNHLFSKILETDDVKQLKLFFKNGDINPYWDNHFQFDIAGAYCNKSLGEKSLDSIIINAIAVITFCYGKQVGNQAYVNAAFNLIEKIDAEANAIVTGFKGLGIVALNAFDSQALLQLKNNYCNQKKCLHCGIGNKILNC